MNDFGLQFSYKFLRMIHLIGIKFFEHQWAKIKARFSDLWKYCAQFRVPL